MTSNRDWTRRIFLKTIGTGVPTLSLLLHGGSTDTNQAASSGRAPASEKFTPIDLTPYFNASSSQFGPRQKARDFTGDSSRDGLIHTPVGQQTFLGIPFQLGAEGPTQKSWVLLSAQKNEFSTAIVEIPLRKKASFICLAAFCDWDKDDDPLLSANPDEVEGLGERLGDAVLIFEDGREQVWPIRRRFEVNSPSTMWGHLSFASLPHLSDSPRKLTEALRDATDWGDVQTTVNTGSYGNSALLWISSLANPYPDQDLKALRFRAVKDTPLIVCGLTLFHGRENPLRHERLTLYRITLPEAASGEKDRWRVEVDLGVVARTYSLTDFEPESWLRSPAAGLGSHDKPTQGGRYLYAEVTVSSEGTLWLRDTKSKKDYAFDLREAEPGKEVEPRSSVPSGARIEVLEPDKAWLHGRVVEATTGSTTPVRLAFRSKEGRYIPPYGHRTEINDAWFQDYGADVKLMDSSFAYVDGTFQVELPVGDVYLEMTKGFEHEAVRRKLTIEPGQRELNLQISRIADLRSEGWVSADTHVHFLSPSTALLEGQAEGLNLINLLAAQWGDLFTNVGDLSAGPLTSRDGEMMVWVGTENRQHILGHIGMLGTRSPVYPMSSSGPDESYLGDPLRPTLADWADACRERDGLAVAVHFPFPTGEIAADIVLGKIDAVEIFPTDFQGGTEARFNTLPYLNWYRYLNCGYRLPGVGGTDKMGAYMPAGTNRVYAHLGEEALTFPNWAKAVRKGNTFVTSGPLLLLNVDGHVPGDEIKLGPGGTVTVQVKGKSFVPFHRLEVVLNGRVVASKEKLSGTREMTLAEELRVMGPGWLAARCSSRIGAVTNWNFTVQAHTSPVYLVVPGQELFSAPAAAYMLTLIDGAQTWTENLAVRPGSERLSEIRKLFEEARTRVQHRLREHGMISEGQL